MIDPRQFINLSALPGMHGRDPIFGEESYLNPNSPYSFFGSGLVPLNPMNPQHLNFGFNQRLRGQLQESYPYGMDQNISSLTGEIQRLTEQLGPNSPVYEGQRQPTQDPVHDLLSRLNQPYSPSELSSRDQRIRESQTAPLLKQQEEQVQAESTPQSANGILNHAQKTGNADYLLNNPLFLEYLAQNFDEIDNESDSIWNDGELEQADIAKTMNEFYGVYNLSQKGFNAEVRNVLAEQFIRDHALNVDELGTDKGNVTKADIEVAQARASTGANRLTIDNPKFLAFLEDRFDQYSGSNRSIDKDEILTPIAEWNQSYGKHHGQIPPNQHLFKKRFDQLSGSFSSTINKNNIAEQLEDKRGTVEANYKAS